MAIDGKRGMAVEKKKRADKAVTRGRILDAALTLIARNGSNNLALTDVVRISGVHRATVYQHFKTREDVVHAAADRFAGKFYDAVLGQSGMQVEPRPDANNIIELNIRFANFVIDNPELCRIWLFEVLGSSNPAKDPVWKEYENSFRQFFATDIAQPALDSEVITILVLGAGVLWPIWARAHTRTRAERKELARRFTDTLLRLAMWGTLKPEQFPEIASYLELAARDSSAPDPAGAEPALQGHHGDISESE